MRVALVLALCLAAAGSAWGETVAGKGDLPICNTKDDLAELIKSVQAKDDAWGDALFRAGSCTFVDAGTRVAIIAEEPEAMATGGKVVKVRALLPGGSRVGYASRGLIEDR